ncbi:transglycosylase family protein [Kitasatospora sp. NPDC085879]|uniref:transglycosylase family protein n=1 Tax=Kitasatospora sp. NPDC085879 TaxID=3154769 RepID=UPI00342CBD3A
MGKHRRPSRTARIATHTRVTGVCGAAVAASLLGSTTASAASVDTWDAVAKCESSGNWANHDSGHNGHYGGLQFSPSSWKAAGGLRYASRADFATKDQQIAVAERLLAMQGPGAWECASAGGLTAHGPAADVHPDGPAASSRSTYTRTMTTASRPVSTSRPTTPALLRTKAGRVKHGRGTYTVRPGDTLFGIARANHLPGGWQHLYGLNRGVVKNADLIFPGQRLRLG